jgi:protein lifeguard
MPSCLPSSSKSAAAGEPDSVATGDAAVRRGFIRKVYSVLTLQFMLTVGMSAAAAFVLPVRDFVVAHTWLVYVGIGVSLGCLIALYCFRTAYPFNVLLLVLFTLGYGGMIAVIVARYFDAGAGVIVLEAAALTAIVFFSLTAVAFVTKKDFSFMGGFLAAAFLILLGASIANFALGFAGARNKWFTFGISCLGALVMTGFILYDTSLIIKRYGPDQWIQGCISLYLDVSNLFMYLLSILSFTSR